MKSRAREIIDIGDRLFSARGSLMSLWQDISEHFLPERSDFTATWAPGMDFAAHLMTGFPALQMRDLADQLAAMLRPRSKLWAKLSADQDNSDQASKQWLEWASERMRRAMYSSHAQFLRATKTADKDFVAFGQAVLLPSLNRDQDGLLFRCFHLRDTAWAEDANGQISMVHRKEKMTVRDVQRYFPKTYAPELDEIAKKDPYKEIECRHIVVPAEMYDLSKKVNRKVFQFVSIYLDKDHEKILEEVPQKRLGYVIPRWQLAGFGQYAVSPCTMLALPDGRLMQQMTLSLLEAAEKSANPPMVATQDVVRTDMQLYSGGVTWVDREYDEQMGAALRPITQDYRGAQYGVNMLADLRQVMKEIFFLNKINLPDVSGNMTAFETRKRVEEYVRAALPLFEPMEVEYNAGICNETFALLMDNNAFGPPASMPPSLRGADVHFEFESPLQATGKRVKVDALMSAGQIVQGLMPVDPTFPTNIDWTKAGKDALDGAEVPSEWILPEQVAQAKAKQLMQAQMMQGALQGAGQVAGVAKTAGEAAHQFSKAGSLSPAPENVKALMGQ